MKRRINHTEYIKENYLDYVTNSGSYKIGQFKFKNKKDITMFIRSYLTLTKHNIIIEDEKIIEFVKELILLHPTKNHYKVESIMVKLYQTDKLHTPYSNFFIKTKDDDEWDNFSTNKCLENIKTYKKEKEIKFKISDYDELIKNKWSFIYNNKEFRLIYKYVLDELVKLQLGNTKSIKSKIVELWKNEQDKKSIKQ